MSNSSTSSATATATFPIFGFATLVLFILKVAGMAGASWGLPNLSWFWVFFPLLLGIGLWILFIAVILLIALAVAVFSDRK